MTNAVIADKRLRDLTGLGAKSEELLKSVGIASAGELMEVGAVEAFIRVRDASSVKPSLNLLYALVGALENRSWLDIARTERESLLMALDGFAELQAQLNVEGIHIEW